MYRLILYILIALIGLAVIFSFFGLLNYSPQGIIFSVLFLVIISWATNTLFAKIFEAPTNIESVYITALILALIINPAKTTADFIFLGWAGVLAMSSKYILAINKKHIFNPVAIAVVLTSYGFGQSAGWWIGNAYMMLFVVAGGYLITRKIHREDLVLSFIFTVLLITLVFSILNGNNFAATINQIIFHSSLFFFAFFMLTEPLTTPPGNILQILYGGLTGILYIPQIHFGNIYTTPELALIVGNIFAYFVSPKQKLILRLQKKIITGKDLADFLFIPDQKLSYLPGQYMEWTFAHPHPDSRGNRRFFTLASSPTEDNIRLGVKFYSGGSSYKHALYELDSKTPIVVSQLAGNFTLPKDCRQKLVFIAGGIGITPFRSMIKYLIDMNQHRDVILFYANKNAEEIVYTDILNQANKELDIKTVYTITDKDSIPANWHGRVGRIDAQTIREEVSDYKERLFYLSGPHSMVDGYQQVLRGIGIKKTQIKKDYFPGFV